MAWTGYFIDVCMYVSQVPFVFLHEASSRRAAKASEARLLVL